MSDKLTSLAGFGEGDPKPEGAKHKALANKVSLGKSAGKEYKAGTTKGDVLKHKRANLEYRMGKKEYHHTGDDKLVSYKESK